MKPVALTLLSRIPFGKYENRLVSDILISDPKYLKWLWVEKKAIAPDNALEQRLRLTPSDFAVAGMKLPKTKLENNMKIKQLREAIRDAIRNEIKTSVPKNQKYIIEDVNDDEILYEGTKQEIMEWMWKKFSDGFNGMEINPAADINENQPAKSPTPAHPEPDTLPKPKIDKPDEKRRKIGNPNVKPAPKNLKEEAMVDKITARFIKAKKQK
jgi:uncharacterized protein (DUF3820 family)